MHKNTRPAIAMIELIFAIVVMGIVMMSAPMLISTATKSGYVAIQQEGINEAASRVNMIMGYAWDEQDTNDTQMPPILITDSPTAGLGEVNVNVGGAAIQTGRRVGIPAQSERTYIGNVGGGARFAASAVADLGPDAVEEAPDDIDDFIGNTNLVAPDAGVGVVIDYVERGADINIATQVAYATDNVAGAYNQAAITYVPFVAVATTSNIKSITVTLTRAVAAGVAVVNELDKTIILQAFSCNVGGYKFEDKAF